MWCGRCEALVVVSHDPADGNRSEQHVGAEDPSSCKILENTLPRWTDDARDPPYARDVALGFRMLAMV